MMTTRRRWFVEGRVQGVWFRESTRREAERIGGLVGEVKNLPDGRVEVRAEGACDRLDALAAFLARGPELAAVQRVTEEPSCPEGSWSDFRISR